MRNEYKEMRPMLMLGLATQGTVAYLDTANIDRVTYMRQAVALLRPLRQLVSRCQKALDDKLQAVSLTPNLKSPKTQSPNAKSIVE